MNDFMEQIEKYRHEFHRYVLRTVWDSSVAENTTVIALLPSMLSPHRSLELLDLVAPKDAAMARAPA